MLAYKIVSKDDGKLLSYCSMGRKNSNEVLEYKLGEKTKPNIPVCGPLACFLTLKDALEFFRDDFSKKNYFDCPWHRYAIYLCEIEKASENYLWGTNNHEFNLNHIPGSVTAWSVILLAEIPYNKVFESLYLPKNK